MYARITGTGSYLPGLPLSNNDLIARGVDTSDEWVATRTGIKFRHLVSADVTSSDLAFQASQKALCSANVDAADLDLIIVATTTPDVIFPSTACYLQAKLGNRTAMAFDVQAVCSGFAYALNIAEKFIRCGNSKKALIIGAETLSRILDWSDRGTCVLFGDGAGAVVLEASDTPGILATVAHANGEHANLLGVYGNIDQGQVQGDPFVRMDGQNVFKFAVNVLVQMVEECCQVAGIGLDDIDWLVPHQANIRIIEATAKKLKLSMDKVIVTVDQHGNTSAASIPLALDTAIRDGRIQRGQKVLLEGIGGGFAWGAVLLEF